MNRPKLTPRTASARTMRGNSATDIANGVVATAAIPAAAMPPSDRAQHPLDGTGKGEREIGLDRQHEGDGEPVLVPARPVPRPRRSPVRPTRRRAARGAAPPSPDGDWRARSPTISLSALPEATGRLALGSDRRAEMRSRSTITEPAAPARPARLRRPGHCADRRDGAVEARPARHPVRLDGARLQRQHRPQQAQHPHGPRRAGGIANCPAAGRTARSRRRKAGPRPPAAPSLGRLGRPRRRGCAPYPG